MAWVVAAASAALFLLILHWVRIIPAGVRVLEVARNSTATLRNPDIHDDEKEKVAQAAALKMMGGAVGLAGRGVAALIPSLLLVYAAQMVNLTTVEAVTEIFLMWEVWVASIIIFVVVYLVRKRLG